MNKFVLIGAFILYFATPKVSSAACDYGDFSCNGMTGDSAYCCYTDLDGDGKNISIYKDPAAGDNEASVGYGAFWENETIENVYIDEGVTSIKPNAFDSATNLISVEMPYIQTLESEAFAEATNLTDIYISDLQHIGEYALAGTSIDYIECHNTMTFCETLKNTFPVNLQDNFYINEIYQEPESPQITKTDCYNQGKVLWDNTCVDEYPFAKKRWTPAEANEWLHDGNDNFVVITFKK